MPRDKDVSDNLQIKGKIIHCVLSQLGEFKSTALDIMKENGLSSVNHNEWYSLSTWLYVINQLYEQLGPMVLFNIGNNLLSCDFRCGCTKESNDSCSIEDALHCLNVGYQQNHRGANVGNYEFVKTDERKGKIICNTPYPTELERGMLMKIAHTNKPDDCGSVFIKLDKSQPMRVKGHPTDTFIIEW